MLRNLGRFGGLTGKPVCHPQRLVDTDTIAFTLRGTSPRVVGLDLSAESLNYACDFAAQADAVVVFIQSNVYDASEAHSGASHRAHRRWSDYHMA